MIIVNRGVRALTLAGLMALLLSGCSRTAMYHPPGDEDPQARVLIQSDLESGGGEDGGWRMPGTGDSEVALFKVDGRRVSEQGGGDRVLLEPGERTLEVFADHQGILRFGELTHEFEAGSDYSIVISAGDGEDQGGKEYRAELFPYQSGVHEPLETTEF